MDQLLQYLSTFLTVYFTDIVKTENRVLDNVIVGILCVILVQPLNFIFHNWKQIYNCIIYHIYRMGRHPLEIWRAPYLYSLTSTRDVFEKQYSRYSPYIYLQNTKGLIQLHWPSYLSKIIYSLLKRSKVGMVLSNDGSQIIPSGGDHHYRPEHMTENGLYLIAIDKYGNPIYYCSNSSIYFKNRDGYLDFENHFGSYATEEYERLKSETIVSNGIYVMKFYPEHKQHKLIKTAEISKKKTFDTLFYTQKDELMNILNKFKSETMYPEHIPMDNKLGILLYGPPGTGKTGTITAIANYLKRNITMINFADISTADELDLILDSKRYTETIFVFDEFDCLLDVLGKKGEEEKPEKNDWATMIMMAEPDEKKQIMEMMKSGKKAAKQNLNLAYLLQKLDGLESAEGRVIIATTNNPDKINPALLRPGRFDLKLCLGNCTQDMYCKILESFYREEKDVNRRVKKANIPDMKYSPLELMNIAMQHNTLDELLISILSKKNKY